MSITYDSGVGRHGTAKKDISFGDVVFVDEPIGMVNRYPLMKLTCFHCLQMSGSQAEELRSPFDQEARFCSEQCLHDAVFSYHCYESRLKVVDVFR